METRRNIGFCVCNCYLFEKDVMIFHFGNKRKCNSKKCSRAMTGRVFTFPTATIIVFVFLWMTFTTVFLFCLRIFFFATRLFGFFCWFTTRISQRWCQKETKHQNQQYGNFSCHTFNGTKVHIFFVRSVLLARSFLRLQVTVLGFAKWRIFSTNVHLKNWTWTLH